MVVMRDGFVIFDCLDSDYSLDLSEIKTYEDIFRWVVHLMQKSWIDKQDLFSFIELALEYNNLPYPAV